MTNRERGRECVAEFDMTKKKPMEKQRLEMNISNSYSKFEKVVTIRLRVYLLGVIWKFFLILEVDPIRGTQIKEANRSPTQRIELGVTIAKSLGITNLSVRS